MRSNPLDEAISRRVLEVVKPSEIKLVIDAMEELERREVTLCRQWQMRIERADYEAQLAERRYMEVDPSNRLVANSLERRWNEALIALETIKQEFCEYKEKELRVATADQKELILSLSEDFPRLWDAPSTKPKDKKRMLRLLIKDITVERCMDRKQAVLHIRWQGGQCEDLTVDLLPTCADKRRYPEDVVEKVRALALQGLSDADIAAALNEEGSLSSTGKPFTVKMIKWIRFKHEIPLFEPRHSREFTVPEAAAKFGVSTHVIHYWINRGIVQSRKLRDRSRHLLMISPEKEEELLDWIRNSPRIQKQDSHS